MRKSRVVFAIVCMVLVTPAVVSAKFDPYLEGANEDWGGVGEDTAWQAPAALPFYGLYGHLTKGDVDAFVYEFDEAVTAFSIQVMVPVCGDQLADFYPSVGLIGPGLETDAAITEGDVVLPFDVPEGMGVQLFVEKSQPEMREIERDLGYVKRGYTSTWWSADIPESGEYLIAVWEPDGREGAYVLATGREHPDYIEYSRERELEVARIISIIQGDTWIGMDCDAGEAVQDAG